MEEYIQYQPDDETAWVCLCGNVAEEDGFATCDLLGADMEPYISSAWLGLYRCNRCYRIINQRDLRVLGSAPEAKAYTRE